MSPQDIPGEPGGPSADDESYLLEDLPLDMLDETPGDDAEAHELDVGVEIDEPETDGENQEADDIDLGEMLSSQDEHGESQADDTPLTIDLAQGLELSEAPREAEGEDAVEEAPIVLDERKLPQLDRDEPDDGPIQVGESLGLSGSDEASLPRSAEPWQLLSPAPQLEACTSLASAGEYVVGASSDLLWFAGRSETPLRLAVDHTSVARLALLGAQNELVIAATRGGKLWRRARQASQAVQLTRALALNDSSGRGARTLELARPDPESSEIWVHGGDGTLRQSLDAGDHFAPVSLAGRVVTLAPDAPYLLLAQGEERQLAVRGPGGFELRAVPAFAQAVARARDPLLVAAGEHVALCSAERAVLLSNDGGRSFRAVPGTANTTALCFAHFREHAWLWAAIYREAADQTLFALIDLERADAECVAVLSGEQQLGDPAERAEWGRVSALSWHGQTARLWAAGGFGLRCLNPLA